MAGGKIGVKYFLTTPFTSLDNAPVFKNLPFGFPGKFQEWDIKIT